MKVRLLLLLASVAVITIFVILQVWRVDTVSGIVADVDGRLIAGATVRVKASASATITDADGRFQLSGFVPSLHLRITAWKDGYYIAGTDIWPWFASARIIISPHNTTDNPDYVWMPPEIESRSWFDQWLMRIRLTLASRIPSERLSNALTSQLDLGCQDCHQAIYDQWSNGAHSQGISNVSFRTMYNGTDVNGNQSPLTEFATHKDYGRVPIRPSSAEPYFGPGFSLDFPDSNGNCATCHLPTLALENTSGADPSKATGVDAQGAHCDFCHKITAVNFDKKTGLTHENRTGILSIEVMRPLPERQLFFGPYDDVDVGPDTFLPLMKDSQVCAACHQASFWGVTVYQSYAEWLASSYPSEGITCQTCHMAPDGITTDFTPGRGGVKRRVETIPTHNFPGAADEQLLQDTAELKLNIQREQGQLLVQASVTNENAGHHIPTDSPLRQIFLIIKVTNQQGQTLPLMNGPSLPIWAGNMAGQPGVYFAKILEELWTEISPTGAYWRQTRLVEDTRLAAKKTSHSTYAFAVPSDAEVTVEAQLIYRRAFYELMQQKGWDFPDIMMNQITAVSPRN